MTSVKGGGQRRPASQRPADRRRVPAWVIRVLTAAIILTAWELYGRSVPAVLFVPPSAVVRAAVSLAQKSELWEAVGISAGALGAGFGIALVAGLTLGLMIGYFRPVGFIAMPYVTFLYAVPYVALIPLFVITLGIGFKVRLAVVVLSAVIPIIINTAAGVRGVQERYRDVSRVFCASTTQTIRTVVLPAATPMILSGIRIAIGHALVGVFSAEILTAQTGLGGLMVRFANFFQTANLLVPLIAIVVECIVLSVIIQWGQRKVAAWSS